MSEKTLLETIKNCQDKNEAAVLEIMEKFRPLLKKYSYKLGADDAYSEFTVFLIELIDQIPVERFAEEAAEFCLLSYIRKAVYFQYIKLSKEQAKYRACHLELNEDVHSHDPEKDADISLELKEGIRELTPLQRDIIKAKYYGGFSDAEIGKYLNVTRQAINRAKNRALEQLKIKIT